MGSGPHLQLDASLPQQNLWRGQPWSWHTDAGSLQSDGYAPALPTSAWKQPRGSHHQTLVRSPSRALSPARVGLNAVWILAGLADCSRRSPCLQLQACLAWTGGIGEYIKEQCKHCTLRLVLLFNCCEGSESLYFTPRTNPKKTLGVLVCQFAGHQAEIIPSIPDQGNACAGKRIGPAGHPSAHCNPGQSQTAQLLLPHSRSSQRSLRRSRNAACSPESSCATSSMRLAR